MEAVARALEDALPDIPVPLPAPLTQRIDVQLSEQQLLMRLLWLLSGFAVILAAVGLYGVIAFGVASRRTEFGIRIALGADGGRIRRLVFRSAAGIIGVGTALGFGGAFALSRLIESRLFGVAPMDAPTYLGSAVLLGIVAGVACWIPARRAATTDPAATLLRG
jgi:ABC-type antimicrobial peptide transport system permease subunit